MLRLLIAFSCLLSVSVAARANFLVELSFQNKLDASDVVIVGTIVAVKRGRPGQYDGTATVRAVATLKGQPQAEYVIFTESRIVEDNLRCCEIGATYMMFLKRTPGGPLASVDGQFGIISVGPTRNEPEVKVIPSN